MISDASFQSGEGDDGSPVGWALFLLLNATLFMRPAEIVPQLEGLPIYNVIICACLIASCGAVVRQLQPRVLMERPITLCALGVVVGVVVSLVVQGDLAGAWEWGIELIKVVTYYILVVACLSSARRIRQFLLAIAVFAVLLNVVALLSYHHIVDLATVAPMEESQFEADPITGEHQIVVRLQAAGIYANPNDLSRIIAVGITVCIFAVLRRGALLGKLFWVGAAALLSYALQLTYSRGGLLTLMSGILVLLYAKFGAKRGGILLMLLLPVLLVFGGRQTDIDPGHGTAQKRIQLWSKGLGELRQRPLFGIGTAHYFAMAGNHAHNSFVEAYVEMGVFGGSFFACAFVLATGGCWRAKGRRDAIRDPELMELHPYVFSLVVQTIVSEFSSSREYSQPTYMILGTAAAFLALAARRDPAMVVRVNMRLFKRMAVASVCVLVFLHLYVKVNAQ